jgi:succinate dehydrogenase hydrophobic anchor subunit
MLLALLVIGTLVVRVRQSMPRLNPLIPWLTQLITSVACVLYTLVLLRVSVDSTEVPSAIGNQMIMNSSPSIGVFIALLASLGAMAGSLMGLKERPA